MAESLSKFLSNRGCRVADFNTDHLKWASEVNENSFHKDDNPDGIINLGMAEIPAVEDLVLERISRPDMLRVGVPMLYYFNFSGTASFKKSVADFLTERLHTHEPVEPKDVIIQNGCGSILDSIAAAVGDPGDALLCPTPCYSMIQVDVGIRAGLKCVNIPLTSKLEQGDERPFQLTVKKIERAFLKAKSEGENIRGILLMNPHNPLGDIYSLELIKEILDFCSKHELHVIMDEIYALSVFDETSKFESILTLPSLPDPQRTHFVWGFSKDFGLSGLRCGVLVTKSEAVKSYCEKIAYYQCTPPKIQYMLKTLIEDKDWLDNIYFPKQKKRMKSLFNVCYEELSQLGVTVHPGVATFFIWADFSPYLEAKTAEAELELFKRLLKGGVYVIPGTAKLCEEPGWFRLVFPQKEIEIREGMKRIKMVLTKEKANLKEC